MCAFKPKLCVRIPVPHPATCPLPEVGCYPPVCRPLCCLWALACLSLLWQSGGCGCGGRGAQGVNPCSPAQPCRKVGASGLLIAWPWGDSWWWVLPEASPGSLTVDVERWNASVPSREGGDGPLSKPWTCNCCLPLCGKGEGDSQRRSFIKQTGFNSFCPCAGVFFPFPPKHPRHFQPLAQRSESGGASSPNREWVAGFARLCKRNVVSL